MFVEKYSYTPSFHNVRAPLIQLNQVSRSWPECPLWVLKTIFIYLTTRSSAIVASSTIAPVFLPSLRPPTPTPGTSTVPILNTRPPLPPFLHRVGFAAAFGTASYVLAAGDVRNSSGIATAWSLAYLFFHLRNALRPPRHPVGLALAGSVTGCATLYGMEYFYFQD